MDKLRSKSIKPESKKPRRRQSNMSNISEDIQYDLHYPDKQSARQITQPDADYDHLQMTYQPSMKKMKQQAKFARENPHQIGKEA